MFCNTILSITGTFTFTIIFTFIVQGYPVNCLLVEVRKHNTNFSIFCHYCCLLLPVLLLRNTNPDLKICRYIRLHICQRFHIIQLFVFATCAFLKSEIFVYNRIYLKVGYLLRKI